MTTRPLLPPAHAAAIPPRATSSSGVGTYGGLNTCTPHHALTDQSQLWDTAVIFAGMLQERVMLQHGLKW